MTNDFLENAIEVIFLNKNFGCDSPRNVSTRQNRLKFKIECNN